ncbi:hypothetical protein ACWFRK_39055 [Streptomyces sp. NPDC055157]
MNLGLDARLNLAAATVLAPEHQRTPTTGGQPGAHELAYTAELAVKPGAGSTMGR